MASKLYRPLNREADEIRLLVFQPLDPRTSRLHFELRYVPLKDSPEYHALSYAWGTETETRSVVINGEIVQTRLNLYAALCQLEPEKTEFILWCDALCINQSDIEERNYQVLRMGDIYGGACMVLIWLGMEDDESASAFSHLRLWADNKMKIDEKIVIDPAKLFHRLDPMLFDPARCKAMERLLKRSWWLRIWVIQEVLLSRDVQLICGRQQCPWTTYLQAVEAMRSLSFNEYDLQYLSAKQRCILQSVISSHQGRLYIRLDTYEGYAEEMSLLQLFSYTTFFLASDPRDMLYGLLGLNKIINSLTLNINIDYGAPVYQVYSDLVRTFVWDRGRLSLLGGAGVGLGVEHLSLNLPSWVPDLRNFRILGREEGVSNLKWDVRVGAAGSTDAFATFTADFRILSAQGIICSDVQDTRSFKGVTSETLLDDFFEWRKFVSPETNSFHPTGIPYLQAFFRTLILDYDSLFTKRDFATCNNPHKFYSTAAAFLYAIGHGDLKQKGLRPRDRWSAKLSFLNDYARPFAIGEESPVFFFEQDVLEPFLGPKHSKYRLYWPRRRWSLPTSRGRRAGYARRLFVELQGLLGGFDRNTLFTLKDGYFGIGPPGTRKGDRLCILLGCEFPLVIRPQGQQFVLVGSCYVYGAMRGEFIDDVVNGKRDIATVELV